MQKAEVRCAWQLRLEVGSVVLEKGESIRQALYWVVKVDVNKDTGVKLLVSPEDLQKGLKPSLEHIRFFVSGLY